MPDGEVRSYKPRAFAAKFEQASTEARDANNLTKAQMDGARSLLLLVMADMPNEWRVEINTHTSQPPVSIAVATLRELLNQSPGTEESET